MTFFMILSMHSLTTSFTVSSDGPSPSSATGCKPSAGGGGDGGGAGGSTFSTFSTNSDSTTGSAFGCLPVFCTSRTSTNTGWWSDRPTSPLAALCRSFSCMMPPPMRRRSLACASMSTLS